MNILKNTIDYGKKHKKDILRQAGVALLCTVGVCAGVAVGGPVGLGIMACTVGSYGAYTVVRQAYRNMQKINEMSQKVKEKKNKLKNSPENVEKVKDRVQSRLKEKEQQKLNVPEETKQNTGENTEKSSQRGKETPMPYRAGGRE